MAAAAAAAVVINEGKPRWSTWAVSRLIIMTGSALDCEAPRTKWHSNRPAEDSLRCSSTLHQHDNHLQRPVTHRNSAHSAEVQFTSHAHHLYTETQQHFHNGKLQTGVQRCWLIDRMGIYNAIQYESYLAYATYKNCPLAYYRVQCIA